jgi:NADPH:quinone reductase-like Zn-dependent oxidoreductase
MHPTSSVEPDVSHQTRAEATCIVRFIQLVAIQGRAMKAVQFAEYGDPAVLRVVDVDEPHASAGQIRVAVRAAGVNPVDGKLRSGALHQMMPLTLPSIPGSDVAGVVDEIGDGVDAVSIGDEVFGFAVSGGSAEYAVVDHFAAKPPVVSWAVAAGLPLVTETAVRTLDLLGVTAGTTLLINGAAGGVGTAATQFARARGASVIGTASPHNHDYLRSLGATPTTYGEGLAARVREIASDGVDLALDAAGFGALPDLIDLTGGPDTVVTIADFAAHTHGVRLSPGPEGRSFHALDQVAALLTDGKFTMPVRTFPLAQAADAHAASQAGHVRGKLVLAVVDDAARS